MLEHRPLVATERPGLDDEHLRDVLRRMGQNAESDGDIGEQHDMARVEAGADLLRDKWSAHERTIRKRIKGKQVPPDEYEVVFGLWSATGSKVYQEQRRREEPVLTNAALAFRALLAVRENDSQIEEANA